MTTKPQILKTVYIDDDIDKQLTVEAFDTKTPKNVLFMRYLRLGMKLVKETPAPELPHQLFVQPEDNEFAPQVFTELMALSASFRERQYFSIADDLEVIALGGPDRTQSAAKAEVLRQCASMEAALVNLRESIK
jgi:hypothetical protein